LDELFSWFAMPYTKTIVCLANSPKLTGRCVAGKEWDGKQPGACMLKRELSDEGLHPNASGTRSWRRSPRRPLRGRSQANPDCRHRAGSTFVG